jgi:hypothetical protein
MSAKRKTTAQPTNSGFWSSTPNFSGHVATFAGRPGVDRAELAGLARSREAGDGLTDDDFALFQAVTAATYSGLPRGAATGISF